MGSLLEPAEIRYTIISIVALTVMTGMLGFMGISGTGGGQFSADEPRINDSANATVNPANPATYSAWEPSSTDFFSSSSGFFGFLGSFFEFMTDAIAYPFTLMNQWSTMVANAGWASIFIVVPSIVMLLVVVNAMYKLAKAIPYT